MKMPVIVRRCSAAIAAALLLIYLPACQSPAQKPPPPGVAAIVLIGNPVGSTLIIDNLLSFQITSDNRSMEFKVQSGEHNIRLERAGVILTNRTVLLNKDELMQLSVP